MNVFIKINIDKSYRSALLVKFRSKSYSYLDSISNLWVGIRFFEGIEQQQQQQLLL